MILRQHGPRRHECDLPGLFERFFSRPRIKPGDQYVCDQCGAWYTLGWDYENYDIAAEWIKDKAS